MLPIRCILSGLVMAACILAVPVRADAQEKEQAAADNRWIKPGEKLSSSTVTVRVICEAAKAKGVPESANPTPSTPPTSSATDEKKSVEKQVVDKEGHCSVTVCTGICVDQRRFVTAIQVGSDSKIRLTFPGGGQSDAQLRVIDEFSGLALVESTKEGSTPIEFAAAPCQAGAWVMAASAWGVEKPILSLGVCGAVDRTLTGGNYPPLMQCDLPTTDTSCGSGVVDCHGKLLGVVVAADRTQTQRGWSYVVPVSHVQRLLRAADDGKQEHQEGDQSVIVLKRRRPIVGMVLETEGENIVVRRLFKDGPAEKAGLKIGDRVIAVDGVQIRSVNQAVVPTIYKQPGDTVMFRVARGDLPQEIQVVLGGGVELSSLPGDKLYSVIQPKIEIGRKKAGTIYEKISESESRDVAQLPGTSADGDKPDPTSAAKIALLEKALERYQKVIELQQEQLRQREQDRAELAESLKALKAEVEALRRRVDEKQPADKGK